MRVTVTGATGLVGRRVVAALQARGDEVTVLSRRPDHAERLLGVLAVGWDPSTKPVPTHALAGRDGVVHLAGEPIAQRWTAAGKERIRASRVLGTARIVEALGRAAPRPPVLVCASAVGYYGSRGADRLDELAPPGDDFLAGVCEAWEREAQAASLFGVRVVSLRTGVLLDRADGALARMLPPFRLGLGGPVAGGDHFVSWVAPDDLVRLYMAALDDPKWVGPVNATAPEPVTNRDFSRALGRALHRPAVLPVPGFALRTMYGEMASVVTTGQRAVPTRALEHGFEFRYPTLDGAFSAALARH